jgi:5-methylcytosine-specific restriction endonuclease McrA
MPTRAPSPCPTPRCPNVQPCADHVRRPFARSKPRRQPAGNGWAWQRTRQRILARDGHRCRYCGKPATVVDHVVNIAAGGSDDDRNLAAAPQRMRSE